MSLELTQNLGISAKTSLCGGMIRLSGHHNTLEISHENAFNALHDLPILIEKPHIASQTNQSPQLSLGSLQNFLEDTKQVPCLQLANAAIPLLVSHFTTSKSSLLS